MFQTENNEKKYKKGFPAFMRFLYVAHRYHTNQAPIMKNLVEQGHEVCFLAHHKGATEDYSYVTPVIGGYSPLFQVFNRLYVNVFHRKDSHANDMRLKLGFPSGRKIRKIVKEFAPDIMIIRERSVYSIVVCRALRKMHIPAILYNQSPVYEKEIKNDLAHRIVKSQLPKHRITPVYGNEATGERDENVHFVPFVTELKQAPSEKKWFAEGHINLLCVAKYEERKNIRMLIEIIGELRSKSDVTLTVVGECVDHFEQEYKASLEKVIRENQLESCVTLVTNRKYSEIDAYYKRADLFVLPSTREPASVSQLEAMACSTPAIVSDTNGTECYVEDGVSGALFKDNDKESLKEAILRCIESRDSLVKMGQCAYERIEKMCSFTEYFKAIMAIYEDINV